MAGNSKRTIIQLESTAGTGYRYTFTKSKKKHPGRIEFRNLILLLENMLFLRKRNSKNELFINHDF